MKYVPSDEAQGRAQRPDYQTAHVYNDPMLPLSKKLTDGVLAFLDAFAHS